MTDHVERDCLPKVRVNYNNVNAENGNGEADNILVRMAARNNSQKFLAKLGFFQSTKLPLHTVEWTSKSTKSLPLSSKGKKANRTGEKQNEQRRR